LNLDNININNIPDLQHNSFGYREVAESKKLNDVHEATLNDILNLYNVSNELEKMINESNELSNIQSYFNGITINELEDKIRVLEASFSSGSLLTKNVYIKDFTTEILSDNKAAIDVDTLDCTLTPLKTISRINLYNEYLNKTIVYKDIISKTTTTKNNTLEPLQYTDFGQVENIFDDSVNTYWFRKVVTDNTTDYVTTVIEFAMPEEILTSRLVNEVIINPFPVNNIEITNIEYSGNGSWKTIPGFYQHPRTIKNDIGTIYYMPKAKNTKFNFLEENMTSIRITLKQSNYIQDGSNRVFYQGLNNIKVNYNIYDTKEYEFAINTTLNTNSKINTIELIFNNKELLHSSDSYTYEVYYESYHVGETIIYTKLNSLQDLLPNGNIQIRFKIKESGTTPNINNIKITYIP
jgi:hypothetical protein